MNKYLEQLVNLSSIDKEIDSFEPKISAVSKPLNDIKHKISRLEKDMANFDNEIKDIKAQQIANNARIVDFNAKLEDFAKKTALVKTEREANAIKMEEDIAREQLEATHDEIVRLDNLLASKESLKKDCEEAKTKEMSALNELATSTDAKVAELEKARNAVSERKNKLLSEMNQKILTFYQKIRKWARNSAVVPVRKQACYGCFMKIYDKTYMAILKGDEIITCPHCGRILYKENADTEPKEATNKKKSKSVKESA